jgi:hypothetical protein
MTIVKEVADVIEMVGKMIKGTRDIVDAFKDAGAYLRRSYPEVPQDLSGLLTEMRKTLVGLAEVTDVITDFQFTVDGEGVDHQPARFNDMVIDRKHRLVQLGN